MLIRLIICELRRINRIYCFFEKYGVYVILIIFLLIFEVRLCFNNLVLLGINLLFYCKMNVNKNNVKLCKYVLESKIFIMIFNLFLNN